MLACSGAAPLLPAQAAALDEEGYLVVPGALSGEHVERLRRAFSGGSGTEHVAISPATPEHEAWRSLETTHAACLGARHVLARPFRVADLNGRNPLPGYGQQGLHADWMVRTPPPALVTCIFMLDDFTPQNGATRVVPGSHRLGGAIPKSLAQPHAHHPNERLVTGTAGSVLLFNGYLWHSGTQNRSTGPRRAAQMIVLGHELRWHKAEPSR
jgi:ectoine hydroxylase-related dioxygenase (phytanoyl-CoA dioxygenase family)